MIYSGFWRRFAASFIDSLVLNILLSPLAGMMMMGVTTQFTEESFMGISETEALAMLMPMFTVMIVVSVISFILQILYFAFMESSKYQATLGKMALGVVVTDLDGSRITFGRAAGRNLGKVLSGLILMIGYIMAAFTGKKQALHDLMAGTLVLKKAAASAATATGVPVGYQTYESDKRNQEVNENQYDDENR